MQDISEKQRVLALVGYVLWLCALQFFVIEPTVLPNEKTLWLYSGIASLLFGSHLLNPHFTPPAVAAVNGFFALSGAVAATVAIPPTSADAYLLWGLAVVSGLILISSLLVLVKRAPIGLDNPAWITNLDRAVRSLGGPKVIFTWVILVFVWVFHRTQPVQVFAILASWGVIVALSPIESLLAYISRLRRMSSDESLPRIVGVIAAHQSPGIVLIRQSDDTAVERGTALLIADSHGPSLLGVALNYVGRDEGNLLRALTLPMPRSLEPVIARSTLTPGVATSVSLSTADIDSISQDQPSHVLVQMSRFCGIVDQDTSLDFLQFEVIEDSELAEGRLVEASVSGHPVLYQIIEGLTREEIVQQKNKYGYARAKARKIGIWDVQRERFAPAKWLPRINSPVFLKATDDPVASAASVGYFPATSYSVSIDISQAVSHNTAILGVLGIGKTYLSVELVERMIARGVKVICFDLTNQYTNELSAFLDQRYDDSQLERLYAVCGRGRSRQNKEEGGTRLAFKEEVTNQFRAFLNPANERYLRIYNPTRFDVWQQTGGLYQGSAAMASLTACEITAIMSEAALEVAQENGMKDEATVCLVFEEAHSLVPEWNSVAAEGDKTATAATARAILQGRKYGLGCLLITQRTANVTKTILNQCNSIFAMRIFDDTGKEFLSNYIGRDYAGVLPSLEARHAVFFGRASSCENPVLIRLNDREQFLREFRAVNAPRVLPDQAAEEEEAVLQSELENGGAVRPAEPRLL